MSTFLLDLVIALALVTEKVTFCYGRYFYIAALVDILSECTLFSHHTSSVIIIINIPIVQMEAKVAFARLFQKYQIELSQSYELVPVSRTTVQPKDDVYCKIKSRSQLAN